MDSELNERFERLEGIVAGQIEAVSGQLKTVSGLLKLVAENEREHARFRQAQQKTDEHLGIVIRMMDEWIRGQRNGGRRPRPRRSTR